MGLYMTAKEEMKKKSKHPQDNRLSKREFRQFVIMVCDHMPGADAFEYFVEFLNNSVEVKDIVVHLIHPYLFLFSGKQIGIIKLSLTQTFGVYLCLLQTDCQIIKKTTEIPDH